MIAKSRQKIDDDFRNVKTNDDLEGSRIELPKVKDMYTNNSNY
jgi:hypothetical protein